MKNSDFKLNIVIDILSKHVLSGNQVTLFNQLNLKAFEKCIHDIIDHHEQSIEIKEIFGFQHATNLIDYKIFNFLEDDYKFDRNVDDITVLTFNSLYPSIIVYLIKNDLIKFNLDRFGELFVFLFENHKVIKQMHVDQQITDVVYYNLKFILNATYGLLTSKHKHFLYSDMKSNMITKFLEVKIVKMLNFTNCIAGNTDEFYFNFSHDIHKNIFELVCDDFAKLGLSFEIETKSINFNDIRKFQHCIRHNKK